MPALKREAVRQQTVRRGNQIIGAGALMVNVAV
jgi:hypothetical protein